MPAPKGNENGKVTWYRPLSNQPTVQLGVRVPASEAEEIEQQLEPGESRSEWLRKAIATYKQMRQVQ